MDSCSEHKLSELENTQHPASQDLETSTVTDEDAQTGITSPSFSLHDENNREWNGSWSRAHLSWIAPTGSTPVSIDGRVVTIRNLDGWIDVNELLMLPDVKSSDRQGLELFFLRAANSDRANRPQQEDSRMWISYGTAHLLCEKLKLQKKLASLLLSASEVAKDADSKPCAGLEDYIGHYHIVPFGESTVYINAADYTVNADHIAIAAGRKSPVRHALRTINASWIVVNRGLQRSKGKYVDMADALFLCDHFRTSGLKEKLRNFEAKPLRRENQSKHRESYANCRY